MCGLKKKKKSECQSKEQLSLHLTSAHGLFALVFIWPSALLLWNREKFCLLEVLACQRTLSLWLCPFIKFTPSAVNSAASRTLAGGRTFESWMERLRSLVQLDCFDLGPKNHKDGRHIQAKKEVKWNVNILGFFFPSLLFADVGCFTVHILVLMQCLLNKYCELFCKWNVLC